jgi:hypothetical protein
VTEWVPIDNAVARKEITKRKRHFNVSKSSFISSVHSDAATVNPCDVLIDESKQADIENLGDCLRVLGDGDSADFLTFLPMLLGSDNQKLAATDQEEEISISLDSFRIVRPDTIQRGAAKRLRTRALEPLGVTKIELGSSGPQEGKTNVQAAPFVRSKRKSRLTSLRLPLECHSEMPDEGTRSCANHRFFRPA